MPDAQEERQHTTPSENLSSAARAYYSVLLFGAYWFGSARFDSDEDDDFNPEDVQAYLEDPSVLQRNMMRTTRTITPSARATYSAGGGGGSMSFCSTVSKETAISDGGGNIRDAARAKVSSRSISATRSATRHTADAARGGGILVPECFGAELSRKTTTVHEEDGAEAIDLESEVNADLYKIKSEAVAAASGTQDLSSKGNVATLLHIMMASVSGRAYEDICVENIRTGQIRPVMILLHSMACFTLWAVTAAINSERSGTDFFESAGGLDKIWEGWTLLRFVGPECEDRRFEAWRWLSYQFTHVGFAHVFTNSFLNLTFGIPLEGVHGHFRIVVMHTIGVFGGACFAMLMDVHTSIVGCSGGSYALIGVHIADLVMNWRERRFRYPTLCVVVALVFADAAFAVLNRSPEVSYSTHAGGIIAGLLICILMGKNLKVRSHEKYIVRGAWILGFALITFCLAWLFSQHGGRLSIWEAMSQESPWCWHGQVLNMSRDPTSYRCVRCATRHCVDGWLTFNVTEASAMAEVVGPYSPVLPVALESCQTLGWYDDEH